MTLILNYACIEIIAVNSNIISPFIVEAEYLPLTCLWYHIDLLSITWKNKTFRIFFNDLIDIIVGNQSYWQNV